jgi:hypothetical protein
LKTRINYYWVCDCYVPVRCAHPSFEAHNTENGPLRAPSVHGIAILHGEIICMMKKIREKSKVWENIREPVMQRSLVTSTYIPKQSGRPILMLIV